MEGARSSVSLPSASTRDVGEGLPRRFRNRSATPLKKSLPLDGSSESNAAGSCGRVARCLRFTSLFFFLTRKWCRRGRRTPYTSRRTDSGY
jgi:hypothetical protein